LRSDNLSFIQKLDGLLLLNVYFMPIIAFVSFIVGLSLICFGVSLTYVLSVFWLSLPIVLYSFVGNFAPFFEVGVGLYLDGRRRSQWLIPLSLMTFVYNLPICTMALIDLVVRRVLGRERYVWQKTSHLGSEL
jgi:hypothetical protein